MKQPTNHSVMRARATIRFALACALMAVVCIRCTAYADEVSAPQSLGIGTVTINVTGAHDSNLSASIASVVREEFRGTATEQRLSSGLHSLVLFLESQGYRRARVAPSQFTADEETLNFALSIDPGPLSIVRRIEFSGAANTDTAWLRGMVNPEYDVPLTRVWIGRALDRLNRVSHLSVSAQPRVDVLAEHPETGIADVRVVFAITEHAPSRFDGLVAANGQGDQTALTGRASLEFGGLFGRDRSLAVHFDRPRPEWRTFNVRYHESGALHAPLSWSLELDELTRHHRRQSIGADASYALPWQRDWSLGVGALWRRVTPNGSLIRPARISEVSLSVSRSPSRFTGGGRTEFAASVSAAFSHRRLLGSDTDNLTESRWRLTQRAHLYLNVTASWTLLVSSAGQWWPSVGDAIGPGDEWYLGGAEMLRGYEQQWFAAADGVWGALEIERRIGPVTRLSAFAEAANLNLMLPDNASTLDATPYSYGWAVSLHSMQRVGRLEFAWGKGASLRDGIVRLRMTQSW